MSTEPRGEARIVRAVHGTQQIKEDPDFELGLASGLREQYGSERLRLYRADWGAFATWCDAERLDALPADPATVARFLADSGWVVNAWLKEAMRILLDERGLHLPDEKRP